jgi:hypothetical protein
MSDPNSDAGIEPEVRPFKASGGIDKLAAALAAAQLEMPAIEKDKTAKVETRTGGSYTYDYADLASILKVTRPVLARHGLAVLQPVTVEAKGSVVIKTIILHASGQWIAESLTMPVVDSGDPQKLGSALSYGRRYAYCGVVGITPEDEDDDGTAAAGVEGSRQNRRGGRSAATPVTRETRSGSRTPEVVKPTPAPVEAVSEGTITTVNADGTQGGQRGRLLAILDEHRVDKRQFGAYLREKYNVSSWSEIRQQDYDAIVSLAQAWPAPASARDPGQEG